MQLNYSSEHEAETSVRNKDRNDAVPKHQTQRQRSSVIASAQAPLGGTDELGEWNFEFSSDGEQCHDSGVVCSALESANDVPVQTGAMRQRFLAHA